MVISRGPYALTWWLRTSVSTIFAVTASLAEHNRSTTYSLFETTANLGTTTAGVYDTEDFQSSSSTGRPSQYQYTINGQTDTGVLTWNQNGTLNTLKITDNIPSTADTQTCTYAHDDLVRIASVNCTSGSTTLWQQTFTPDVFSNLSTTSGSSSSFTASFNNKNQISTNNGFVPSYDASGNLLDDPVNAAHNVYSWDADGKLLSANGTSAMYDALGRVVELSPSTGTYSEVLYGPAGDKLALLKGTSLTNAWIPLPGGAMAVYNSSGMQYYEHPDWLGSARLATTPARAAYSESAYSPYGLHTRPPSTPMQCLPGSGRRPTPVCTISCFAVTAL